mgnify:CR=1 FL=1
MAERTFRAATRGRSWHRCTGWRWRSRPRPRCSAATAPPRRWRASSRRTRSCCKGVPRPRFSAPPLPHLRVSGDGSNKVPAKEGGAVRTMREEPMPEGCPRLGGGRQRKGWARKVPEAGLEPARVSPTVFETVASANSATRA